MTTMLPAAVKPLVDEVRATIPAATRIRFSWFIDPDPMFDAQLISLLVDVDESALAIDERDHARPGPQLESALNALGWPQQTKGRVTCDFETIEILDPTGEPHAPERLTSLWRLARVAFNAMPVDERDLDILL